MLPGFVLDTPLRMATVISGEAITAAAARERVEKVVALSQFPKPKIENAGAMAVYQHHSQQRRSSQQMRDRLQMEMPVHKKLGAGQRGGQLILAPEVLTGAGVNGLAMRAVAAQFSGKSDHALNISACAVLGFLALQMAHGLTRQIFNQNRIFLVRLIARSGRLEIKTYRTGFLVLKFGQFTDLFASNTHG